MSEPLDLSLIGRTLDRLVTEVGSLRDDMTVQSAIINRMDNILGRVFEELRGMHRQHYRLANRVRKLEGPVET